MINKRYIWAAQWALFSLVFFCLLATCNRGLDLTDESYYIFWTVNPGQFDASIHPFGLLLHPLYMAFGQSIIALRVCGVLALAGSGILLGAYVAKYYKAAAHRELAFDARALTALFAMSNYVAVSILTPSYNMLANVAGCLIFAGALGWEINDARAEKAWQKDIVPSLLVGFGGALAGLEKPTFAALALLAIAVQLVGCWRRRPVAAWQRVAWVAVACVLPLALAVTGTIPFGRLVQTFQEGQSTLKFGNSLSGLPYKTLRDLVLMPPLLIFTILGCGVLWKLRPAHRVAPRWMRHASLGLLLLAVAYLCGSLGRAMVRGAAAGGALGGPTLAIMISLVTLARVKSDNGGLSPSAWWPVAGLMVLPLAIAFGTANPLASQTATSLFAMLLALAIMGDLLLSPRAAVGLQATLAAMTVLLLGWTSFTPYGLPAPIWNQTVPFRLPPTGERLYVDRETADYAAALESVAATNGLTPGTPIIDLSGGGPGTALLLGGRAPYFPWIVHIFGGASRQLADTVWHSLNPADQRRAWIVLPADPIFATSDALGDVRRAGLHHAAGRATMTFWNTPKQIEVWVPATPAR